MLAQFYPIKVNAIEPIKASQSYFSGLKRQWL